MAHTYTSVLIHLVFATRERRPFLTDDIRGRVHEYLGGIANALRSKPLIINGVEDHAHTLLELPPTLSIAELTMKLKANSSKWIGEELARFFEWQRGYSAFSVSRNDRDRVIRYIEGQEEHHKRKTYEDELRDLLAENGVTYDPKYFLK